LNIEELLSTLKAGNDSDISDISYSLLNISDVNMLKQLAENRYQIKPFLAPSYWSSDEKKGAILRSIDRIIRFLDAVSATGCRCAKYTQASYFVHGEAKQGVVEILSNDSDPKTWESKITCKCIACRQQYFVREFEAGFGRRSEWKKLTRP